MFYFADKILAMASAALEGYVNRLVSVITADGRNFVGTLKGSVIQVRTDQGLVT